MNKNHRLGLVIFILINLLLFIFIITFNKLIPFNKINYAHNAHHYLADNRINNGSLNLLTGLGQYDAQWYLRIADKGYPQNPPPQSIEDKTKMEGLSYAFFPLYPLILKFMNVFLRNIELSGFIAIWIFLIASYLSLTYVIKKLYKPGIAIKTTFLLFLFPFSIFYRSYFTEGIFLFLLIWFSHFLINKKWLLASIAVGLLCITRGAGLFILPLFFYYLTKDSLKKKPKLKNIIIFGLISIVPFLFWAGYCYLQTGDPLYFLTVRHAWSQIDLPIFNNLFYILNFFYLPVHDFHLSQLDIIIFFLTLLLLIASKNMINKKLWLISFLLWLGPFLTTDFMSFTRYQTVSFPLFLYLSLVLTTKKYLILTIISGMSLFILSLGFINWYWVG